MPASGLASPARPPWPRGLPKGASRASDRNALSCEAPRDQRAAPPRPRLPARAPSAESAKERNDTEGGARGARLDPGRVVAEGPAPCTVLGAPGVSASEVVAALRFAASCALACLRCASSTAAGPPNSESSPSYGKCPGPSSPPSRGGGWEGNGNDIARSTVGLPAGWCRANSSQSAGVGCYRGLQQGATHGGKGSQQTSLATPGAGLRAVPSSPVTCSAAAESGCLTPPLCFQRCARRLSQAPVERTGGLSRACR